MDHARYMSRFPRNEKHCVKCDCVEPEETKINVPYRAWRVRVPLCFRNSRNNGRASLGCALFPAIEILICPKARFHLFSALKIDAPIYALWMNCAQYKYKRYLSFPMFLSFIDPFINLRRTFSHREEIRTLKSLGNRKASVIENQVFRESSFRRYIHRFRLDFKWQFRNWDSL